MQSFEKLEPRNIIVRMPNWIGDLVMATPILSDLRKAFPAARITAMCRSPICDLLREDPEIDELFCFSKATGLGRRNERKNIIGKLSKGKYDLGILLTHSFSSAWWFWQGKVSNRLGYESNPRKFLLNCAPPLPENIQNQHLVITYKTLLQPLGIPLSDTLPRLYLSQKEGEDASILLKTHGIPSGAVIIGINPGATYGSAKCWLPERFREVAERLLADQDVYLVFFGDQATASLVGEICAGLYRSRSGLANLDSARQSQIEGSIAPGLTEEHHSQIGKGDDEDRFGKVAASPSLPNLAEGGIPSRVVNLAGVTSLRQLASIISLCNVVLTNDSGPMHIADAVGTPVVALFGSTSEIVTGPYRSGTVIHKHVECSPCYQRTCPIDFRCMKQIEADEVYRAVIHKLHGPEESFVNLGSARQGQR